MFKISINQNRGGFKTMNHSQLKNLSHLFFPKIPMVSPKSSNMNSVPYSVMPVS